MNLTDLPSGVAEASGLIDHSHMILRLNHPWNLLAWRFIGVVLRDGTTFVRSDKMKRIRES